MSSPSTKKLLRGLAYGLVGTLLVAINLVAGALFYLTTDGARVRLVALAVRKLAPVFPGGFEVGGSAGSLPRGIVLRDVLIRDLDERPAIEVERIELAYSLLPLLFARLKVNKLLVDGLTIISQPLHDGRDNLATLALLQKPLPPPPKALPVSIRLAKVDVDARLVVVPAGTSIDDYQGPIVQVSDYVLWRAPDLFSEDATIAALRTPDGCRLFEVPSGVHLGVATRGCERLVPAVRERVEATPGPCSGCGEAVASVRDATGARLAIARIAPPSLEIWNLAAKRLEARTTLEHSPAKGRLAWNGDGVHGVYRGEESSYEGGLYQWQPGAAPVLLNLGGPEPNFGDAVFDPSGRFAIVATYKFQRITGGAVECITLASAHPACGTLSTSPANEPAGAGTATSSAWVIRAEGAQWWTTETTYSYDGKNVRATYNVVLIDAKKPAVAVGTFDEVAPVNEDAAATVQPVHCFQSGELATCITEAPSTCVLDGVSAGGAFLVHLCDDELRFTARDGKVAFSRKGATMERWLGADTALVVDATGGIAVDLARKSERPLARGKPHHTLLSGNRARVALGSDDAFRLFALPTFEMKATVRVPSLGPSALSNDGKLLATAVAGDAVEIYATDTAARVLRIDAKPTSLIFRADAAVLFVCNGNDVRAFDVRSGAERKEAADGVTADAIDPLGRVVGIGERTFRRLVDGVVLTIDGDGNAQTDSGFWDGRPLSTLRFRLGVDPFSARWVTTDDLGERLHHKGLVRAFFDGQQIGEPRLARRITVEKRADD